MKRTLTTMLLIGLLGSLALGAAAGAGVQQAEEPAAPERVLIVAVPRLTWQDVVDHELPNLDRFLAESAVGDLSLRTIGPRTSLGEGYASIGAGNRAGVRDADAGRFLAPGERYENGTAAEAYVRRTGWEVEGALLQLSISSILALNDRFLYGAEPGALGEALDDAGRTTVAIGTDDLDRTSPGAIVLDPEAPTGEASDGVSADTGAVVDLDGSASPALEPLAGGNRPAGLAVMDAQGQVAAGSVSRSLLAADPEAPFGIRLDDESVLEVLDETWTDGSVGIVELSDLDRYDLYRSRVARSQQPAMERRTLEGTDALLGQVLERTTADDLVIFVSPAAPRSGETLTPVAIRGPGFRSGTLVSGTTRRDGYVTLPDLAPTILEQLGIDQPTAMTGAPIEASNDGDSSAARVDRFLELNRATRFRDATVMTVTILTVLMQVVLYVLALLALRRGTPGLRRSAALLGLLTMCLPVTTFLLGIGATHRIGRWPYLLAMFAGASLLAWIATRVGRRAVPTKRAVATTLVPVVATYVLLVADIATGGRLQLNTIFGYSPLVAGRFAGFGNPAYSLLSMSAVLMACGAWALFDGDRPGPTRRRLVAGILAMFLLTIVVDGHPSLGSDVGGVLSIIPTAFVVVWLLLGRRIRARVVLLAGLVSVAVLAAFAALDLQRPASEQTHLGRLVRSTFGDGGGDGLTTVITRKVNANLSVLQSSTWTWAIPLALVVLVLMTWRRPRAFKGNLPDTNAVRATLWGGITLCVLGMAVNDSGISIPAVMFTLFLPTVLYEALTPYDLADDAPHDPPGGGGDDDEGAEPVEPEPVGAGA